MRKLLFVFVAALTMGMLAGCDEPIMPKADVDLTQPVEYWVGYRCAGDFELEVYYDQRDMDEMTAAFFITEALTAAKLDPGVMSLMPSGVGAKYTDGKYVWWPKGPEAFLADATPPGDILLADCVELME